MKPGVPSPVPEVLMPLGDLGREVPSLSDGPVVIHSINKSGSLALFKTFRRHPDMVTVTVPSDPRNVAPALQEAQGRSRYLIMGHNLYTSSLPPEPTGWVTLLRNPVARAVSIYSWWELRAPESVAQLSFERWIESPGFLTYSMTSQFTAPFDLSSEDRREVILSMDDATALRTAVARIDRDFAFVGIAEDYEATLFLLAGGIGLTSLPLWRRDVRNPKRPLVETLPDEQRAVIQDRWQADFQLHEHYSVRLTAQSASLRETPEYLAYQAATGSEYKEKF